MCIVRRFAISLVLLSLIPGFAVAPVLAQATTDATAVLTACKFDVGIAASKYQIDALCTLVQVPEDYANPSGKQLDLHVTVLRATSDKKKAEPTFHFEGGPGASAIQNFGQTFYGAYRLLRQDHDVVLIDQRGTGLSSSLQCTEVTDQALADLNKDQSDDEGSASFIQQMADC